MSPDKTFLSSFLKINGVSTDSSDGQITAVLRDASWTDEEIKTALQIIRGDLLDTGIVAVTKHDTTLFRNDLDFSSRQLSKLLAVDVIVDPRLIHDRETGKLVQKRRKQQEIMLWFIILLLSMLIAFLVGWILLFTMKIGPYHEVVNWVN